MLERQVGLHYLRIVLLAQVAFEVSHEEGYPRLVERQM